MKDLGISHVRGGRILSLMSIGRVVVSRYCHDVEI